MTITQTLNHGKERWRINIQWRGWRWRKFFSTRAEAEAFAYAATHAPVKLKEPRSVGWFE